MIRVVVLIQSYIISALFVCAQSLVARPSEKVLRPPEGSQVEEKPVTSSRQGAREAECFFILDQVDQVRRDAAAIIFVLHVRPAIASHSVTALVRRHFNVALAITTTMHVHVHL